MRRHAVPEREWRRRLALRLTLEGLVFGVYLAAILWSLALVSGGGGM